MNRLLSWTFITVVLNVVSNHGTVRAVRDDMYSMGFESSSPVKKKSLVILGTKYEDDSALFVHNFNLSLHFNCF